MQTFGKRIRHLRRMQNLSQGELAEKINLSTAAIGAYEADKNFPTVSILIQLSQIFNVSLDWLVMGNETSSQQLPNISDTKEEVTKLVRLLEEKDKQVTELTNALLNISKLVKHKVANCQAAFSLLIFLCMTQEKMWVENELATKQQNFVA